MIIFNKIILLLSLASLSFVNAQNLIVSNITEENSSIVLTNNQIVKVEFNPKDFKIESEEFSFKKFRVYSNKFNIEEIAKYGIDQLIFINGDKFKYKLDKKNNIVFVLDKEENIVFAGSLLFNVKSSKVLDKISISTNTTNSDIVEAWVALCTMNKLYGNQNKEFLKTILDAVVFGTTAGIVVGLSK